MATKFISIQEAIGKKKGEVAVRGWIYRERGSNAMKFLILRDSSNTIQCVLEREKFKKQWEDIDRIKIESSVEIFGKIKEDKRAPTGFEISADKINIIQIAEDFPINKDLNEELLGDRRHLWLRSRKMTAILKIRSTVFSAIHEYYHNLGFYEFQSPVIIPGGAEEGPSLFELKYFDKKAYLTQTWQLYAESALFALEKIYTMAPTFRAEKSKTSRHLTEFWMHEMEVAWAGLEEVMNYGEELIKHIVKRVLEDNKLELEILGRDTHKLESVLKKKFPRITYDRAIEILNKKKVKIKWGSDLRTTEEEKLMEDYDTPLFITNYPKEIMAFYKPKNPKNPKVAVCFDMIAPEGNHEIMGGSERDMDINELIKTLKSKGEKIEDYEYYLDTRKYGNIPHAGFGMGTERVIKWICGLEDVKDAIAFPRTPTRLNP